MDDVQDRTARTGRPSPPPDEHAFPQGEGRGYVFEGERMRAKHVFKRKTRVRSCV